MKSSANCFGVMLQAAASAAIAFLAGGNSSAESKMLSRLWPLTAGAQGSPSVKTSPFLFLERGMFFAEAPKKETATRGGARKKRPESEEAGEPSFPLSSRGFRGWLREDLSKEVQK